MFQNIFDEVGVGLIVAGITLILTFIWQKGIYPIFENLVYSGLRIDGAWSVVQTNPTSLGINLSIQRDTVLILKQKANKISGEATSTHTKDDKTKDIVYYKVTGTIKDRFLTLFFNSKDKNKIAHSSFLVEYVSTDTMRGFRIFYGRINEEIDSIKCSLHKATT